jgi:hypothetical protein
MGGRDSCCDLRPYSRYRALFVDDELTPDVMPRSHHSRHRRMLAVLHLDPGCLRISPLARVNRGIELVAAGVAEKMLLPRNSRRRNLRHEDTSIHRDSNTSSRSMAHGAQNASQERGGPSRAVGVGTRRRVRL